MSLLEIRQEKDTPAGVEVVAPQGEIDISNIEVLDRVLGEVAEQQPRQLLVDLSGISYIDSAGVSSLMRAGQQTAQQGGRFSLVGGRPFVRRLIRMTGLDRLYPHFETIAAALGREASSPSPTTAANGPTLHSLCSRH
jgi:anti-sigma B factor antagonist